MERPNSLKRMLKTGVVALAAIAIAGASLAATQPAVAAVQATLYVTPDGAGTACSILSPCTLGTAQAQAQALAPTMTGDIDVVLRGGTYKQTSAWTMTSADSGRNGFFVSYKAYPGEVPIISGGEPVTGWTVFDSSKNIWQAPVSSSLHTRQLYVNGVRANRTSGPPTILGSATVTSTGYSITDPTIASWANPSDIEFVYTTMFDSSGTQHGTNWHQSRCGVSSITTTTITMDQPCFSNATEPTQVPGVTLPNSIDNNFALLNEPGQWYLDQTAHKIFYIPRSGETMTSASVIAPNVETLLAGNGTSTSPVQFLRFIGLTFAYATWLGPDAGLGMVDVQANALAQGTPSTRTLYQAPSNVSFHHASNVAFTRNTFTHLGGGALSFDRGGDHNVINGNTITDVSGNGITLGEGTQPGAQAAVAEDTTLVTNNFIHNVAAEYHGGVGIGAIWVKNTTISHNEVSNVPYTGISLGWGWGDTSPMVNNHVDFNHVHDVMQTGLEDGGEIYINGTQGASPVSTVTGNFIDGHPQRYCGALYLDNGASNWQVSNNVIANTTDYWLCMNPGQGGGAAAVNNVVSGNYVSSGSVLNFDPSNTVTGNSTGLTTWPSAAKSVMAAAGLEAAYADILQGQATTNVALGAAATSTSALSGGYAAAQAVDGNSITGWSSTTTDPNAYVQVDLGGARILSSVQIYTRQDYDQPSSRASFKIELSNSSTMSSSTTICTKNSSPVPFQGAFSCNVPTGEWRYIRVAKTDGGYFFLSEIRAFAYVGSYGDTNLSLGAAAAASSSLSASYPVSAANDGNPATLWQSAPASGGAFWQVDLGSSQTLDSIQFLTRQDADIPSNRRDFEIRVSNNSNMSLGYSVACSVGSTPLSYQASKLCAVPTGTWRYVALVSSTSESFGISEFNVWGH